MKARVFTYGLMGVLCLSLTFGTYQHAIAFTAIYLCSFFMLIRHTRVFEPKPEYIEPDFHPGFEIELDYWAGYRIRGIKVIHIETGKELTKILAKDNWTRNPARYIREMKLEILRSLGRIKRNTIPNEFDLVIYKNNSNEKNFNKKGKKRIHKKKNYAAQRG